MNLLFVHDRFGAQGGAESNLLQVAAALGRKGHGVDLAHGPATGTGGEDWSAAFARRTLLQPGDTAAGLRAALAEYRPDVIYLHNAPDLAAVETLAAAGRPVVRMVHDHRLFCLRGCRYPAWSRRPCTRALSPFCVFPCGGFLARPGGPGSMLARWAGYAEKRRELELHRRFSRLLVGSRYMRAELLRNGFPIPLIEVLAPVPPDPAPGPDPSFGDRNLLVFAGQLIRGKGVDVLLRSLALVRRPFNCVILGEGGHRAACEALSRRLGLADRVRFLGYVPPAELAEHYREATAAVVSSIWPEPFGATGLEAMRCGLPVVAFDAGGIGDWLRDGWNGFLVPWMDRRRYAARITQLLDDRALARRLGAQARNWATQLFGFDRYVDRLEDLLVRVRAGRGREAGDGQRELVPPAAETAAALPAA